MYFVLNIGLFGFKKTHKLLLELYTIFITIFYLVGCLSKYINCLNNWGKCKFAYLIHGHYPDN